MSVPHFEPREVTIRFEKRTPRTPAIFVDGPTSPHRYPDGTLCIWYPQDAPENRWVFDDGLLRLLGHIEVHLFREAWWRETDEWLGPEAPHGPQPKQRADIKERDG